MREGRAGKLNVAVAQMARLRQSGFALEYASMAWMVAEAAVAITTGVLVSSIALTGFGLDSVIEFFAAVIVVWQLRGEGEDPGTRCARLIGVTFFALATRGGCLPRRSSPRSTAWQVRRGAG